MSCRNQWFVLLLGMLMLAASPVAVAQEGVGVENLADALEDELLKGLDDVLPEAQPADAGGVEEIAAPPVGEDLGVGPEDDPLVQIGKQMRAAQQLIVQRESLKHAPGLQQEIVDDLAELIEQVRMQQNQQQQQQQQQQQSAQSQNQPRPESRRSQAQQPGQPQSGQPQEQQAGSSPGKPSDRPARDSTARAGDADAEKVDMAAMQDLLKDLWGHLPERAREQMLQSSADEFLPEYELMIEKYFRRLAEDQERR